MGNKIACTKCRTSMTVCGLALSLSKNLPMWTSVVGTASKLFDVTLSFENS